MTHFNIQANKFFSEFFRNWENAAIRAYSVFKILISHPGGRLNFGFIKVEEIESIED
jgi:hypothetical protein